MFRIVSSPAFIKRIKRLNRIHKNRIKSLIEKLEEEGIHATKILSSYKDYVLCEMKSSNPPYRLYAIYDQKEKIFYVLEWEHKNKQRKIIRQLIKKLSTGVELGIRSIFND